MPPHRIHSAERSSVVLPGQSWAEHSMAAAALCWARSSGAPPGQLLLHRVKRGPAATVITSTLAISSEEMEPGPWSRRSIARWPTSRLRLLLRRRHHRIGQRAMNCANACWSCERVARKVTVAPACGSGSLSVSIGSAARLGGGNTQKFSSTNGKFHEGIDPRRALRKLDWDELARVWHSGGSLGTYARQAKCGASM